MVYVVGSCSGFDLEAQPLERKQVTVLPAYDLEVHPFP